MARDWRDFTFEMNKSLEEHKQSILLDHIKRAYDYTQRLTYFVIGAEVVICGYILLYADKLSKIPFLPELFLISMGGAAAGIIWRVYYNSILHIEAQLIKDEKYDRYRKCREIAYWTYVSLTVTLILSIICFGYYSLKFVDEGISEKSLHKKTQHVERSSAETAPVVSVDKVVEDHKKGVAAPKPSLGSSPSVTQPSPTPVSNPAQKQQLSQ